MVVKTQGVPVWHYYKSATAVLVICMTRVQTSIAFIHEPWLNAGKVAGPAGSGDCYSFAGVLVKVSFIIKGLFTKV